VAQKIYYDGNKSTTLPGVYTEFASGVTNPPLQASFGNALIIDTGLGSKGYFGSGFSGGAGINGELKSGIEAVEQFSTIREARNKVRGSEIYSLIEPIFQPQGAGNAQGTPKLFFAKAATTTAGEISYTFTGGGANGGTFTVWTKDEGLNANGFEYDQTHATSTETITDAGVAGDTVTIVISGVTVATYENASSDTIATVVAGLVASAASLGFIEVTTSNATSLTFKAPNWLTGANANAITPTTNVTGTAAGSASQFSSGADGTTLTRGYAAIMRAGTLDTNKFAIDFYRGTFRGNDSDGDSWNFIAEALSAPELVVSSDEFDNIADLNAWANDDFTFDQYFKIKSYSFVGTGAVNAADLSGNTGNNLASGGTETYSTAALDDVLDQITNLDYTFVLSLDNASNAQSTDNSKILTHLATEARFRKFMIIGGDNSNTLATSTSAAIFYNSPRAIVVHSGVKIPNVGSSGFKERSSLYKGALLTGLIGGQAPQTPATFKRLKFSADRHELNKKEQETALNAGVVCTIFDADFGGYIVLQGVNTKQSNRYFIDSDGTSYEISIESIKAQVAKELEINAKILLLGNTTGVNSNTLSPLDVKQFTETYLTSLEGTYIIKSGNVSAVTEGDTVVTSYEFAPNVPVNKLRFIGLIKDQASI
jgi:hypothetical protein